MKWNKDLNGNNILNYMHKRVILIYKVLVLCLYSFIVHCWKEFIYCNSLTKIEIFLLAIEELISK